MDYSSETSLDGAKRDDNDCAVYAVHVATGVEYREVLLAFTRAGRKRGKGTPFHITSKVLETLGWKLADVTERYSHVKTVRRTGNKLPESHTYLVRVYRHILCIRDGDVMDWTKERLHQVKRIYALYKAGDVKPRTTKIRTSYPKATAANRRKRKSLLD